MFNPQAPCRIVILTELDLPLVGKLEVDNNSQKSCLSGAEGVKQVDQFATLNIQHLRNGDLMVASTVILQI
jgi:hypothetical protein